jgi:hypothetical protein
MTTFEINKHILKDGQIVIYQRSDHANPKWQARVSIPGAKSFRRISLKTRDLDEAKRLAHSVWDELYAKVKNGGAVRSKTYKAVALEYLTGRSCSVRSMATGKTNLCRMTRRW